IVRSAEFIPDKAVHVGAIAGELPPLAASFADLDCRNNRAMAIALNQIADDVQQVVDRVGPQRVAVVPVSSTGGIAEGEAAYSAFRRDGVWPRDFHYRQEEVGSLARFSARYLG